MDIAADDINAAGGVDGRKIEIIHVDAKSDLNLSATAALEVIEKGAQIVVPMCDADFGAPGRARGEREGHPRDHLRRRARASAGRRSARSPSTPTRARRPRARSTPSTPTGRWAGAGRTSSAIACSSTRRSSARRSRRAGRASAGRSSARTRSCRATSRSPRRSRGSPTARSPTSSCSRRTREARPRSRRSARPTTGRSCSSAAYSGTFWLKATPHLSNAWVAAVGSSYGDDPRDEVNAFFTEVREEDR